ncbi:MAG: porin [Pseudomonadota bacterium]|nr:porin [Pseudomonadota bacterium]
MSITIGARRASAITALAALLGTVPAIANTDHEELRALRAQVGLLLDRIERLEAQQNESSAQQQALAQQQEVIAEAVESGAGSDPLLEWARKTQFGAYGEVHMNQLESKDQIDYHRFVLYMNHQFNDDLRFFSELELEHSLAGDGQPGEVELEQAFIEYDLNEQHRAKGGLFLIPVGILNETHEPDTFYGVERNNVEAAIIPTTWWEAGAGLSGELAQGFQYDLAIHSGLDVTDGGKDPSGGAIRGGRQKVANALADDPAYTARLKYTGMPGLEVAGTVQLQEDITQSDPASDDAGAVLLETHVVYNRGPFGLRALYAAWDIDGDEFEMMNTDKQEGWYVEPSWRFNDKFGVFTRYSEWDNAAGGGGNSVMERFDIGFNWWLHPNVVVKFDWTDLENPTGPDDDGFNIGLGYSFN